MSNISFFIPSYNCAKTIAESVDSIMEFNFQIGDELLIVNDCSTDNTAEVLDTIKEKYPEIILFNHKFNKGGAAARNTAVEHAKHSILFCLDSDNVLPPNSVTPLKNYLISNNADVASFQHQHFFINDKNKPEYTWSLPEGEYQLKNYLNGNNSPGQHGNYLFTKKSWLNALGYAEGSGALDTWTFGLRQIITGAKMVVLKDTFYYHRLDFDNSYWMRNAEANLWSTSIKSAYALFPFFEIIDENFLNYMLGKGRYTWFYSLNKKPIKLVEKGTKKDFYEIMHQKIKNNLYPKPTLINRIFSKLKRILKARR